MRVLFVNAVGGLGGAERCLLGAMRAVTGSGHEVRLLTCADGPLIAEAAALGVEATVVPMPDSISVAGDSAGAVAGLLRTIRAAPAVRGYVRRLRAAVEAARPDVIHSNTLKTHLFLALARPAAPVVWHLHDFVGARRLMSQLLGRGARRAARAIAISEAVRRDAAGVLGELPIDVVLNAIDVERFSPGEGNDDCLDRLAGVVVAPAGTVRVGLVATYARWKGQDLFLRAAARVVRERPGLNVRFYVIGGPIYQTKGSQWSGEELAALAAALGLGDRVAFVPFQRDSAPVYRRLDVVVHASTKPEPFGLTIVEAMACGRAVIVSRAGGAAEIFADGVDAVGFTPGDEEDLAGKVARLASDAGERERLGAAARRTALERFSDVRLGEELVGVYEQALSSNKNNRAPTPEGVGHPTR
jgi:glycosyltransferase involved in cell wall biosynthesis